MMVTPSTDVRAIGSRFARFITAGVVNTAFGYGLYAVLVVVGFAPQSALLTAYAIGVLWNYVTHARFVFGQSGFTSLPAYVAAYVFVLGLNAVGLELMVQLGVAPLVAQAVLILPAALLSFVLISRILTGAFPTVSRKPPRPPVP
jgi:putative flippase GtrA